MVSEKQKNEYGTYLYKPNQNVNNQRCIVFLHDEYDNPDIFEKFAEELKMFDYFSLSLPGDEMFECDDIYRATYNFTCKYVRDLILSFQYHEIYLIAHGTSAPIALFLASILPHKIKKICLINPFTSKSSVESLKWVSTLPRNIDDMYKVVQRMYFLNDRTIFNNGANSVSVVQRMKNVFHYFEDISNYVEDICSVKILEELRLYEENVRCPIQLLITDQDKWLPAHEAILSFNHNPNVNVVQISKSMHYPLHDQPDATISSIMKFFIRGIGLNNENQLPSKYIYQYLDDEWKEYYRYSFAEKLNSRDLEEYNKKMSEYEKSLPSIKFKNDEYDQYLNEYADNQTRSLDMMYEQANQNYQQTKALEEYYREAANPTIQIDFNVPANVINMNSQGYEVYHDGKGRAYYRTPGGDWKKVKKQK